MNAKSIFQLCVLVKILFLGEAAKKFFIFSGPATKRRGGGVKAGPLRKGTFFWSSKKCREKNVATKLEGVVIRIRILGLKHVWWIFNVYFHLKTFTFFSVTKCTRIIWICIFILQPDLNIQILFLDRFWPTLNWSRIKGPIGSGSYRIRNIHCSIFFLSFLSNESFYASLNICW